MKIANVTENFVTLCEYYSIPLLYPVYFLVGGLERNGFVPWAKVRNTYPTTFEIRPEFDT